MVLVSVVLCCQGGRSIASRAFVLFIVDISESPGGQHLPLTRASELYSARQSRLTSVPARLHNLSQLRSLPLDSRSPRSP